MADCRTMLSALVAAYDQHRRWMMADKFAALQRAVEHARDVLNEPAAIESWHVPRALSDKALRLITRLPMEEIERRLRMDGPAGHERPTDEQLDDLFVEIDGSGETQSWRAFARAVLARWGAAAPAADGEVGDLVLAMKELAYDVAPYTCDLLNRAADLLERQAAAAQVARLPEDAQVIEPANRTILAPVPAPIPVSERLPGPEDCVPHPRTKRGNWCWGFEGCEVPLARPALWMLMCMEVVEMEASHWLPAHALPLPEVE